MPKTTHKQASRHDRIEERLGEGVIGVTLAALLILTMLTIGVLGKGLGEQRFPILYDSSFNHDDAIRALIDSGVGRITEVDFSSDEHRSNVWTRGLSVTESWGTWTEGESSEIVFYVSEDAFGKDLTIESSAFVEQSNSFVEATVFLNGAEIGEMAFSFADRATSPRHIRFALTDDALIFEGPNRLDFHIEGASSPASLGLSTDPRVLGLGLVRMSFQ